VSTSHYFQPESVEELESLVAHAHTHRQKLRPVGSGLSPNGLGFAPGGMVNLALCDKARCTRARGAGACRRLPCARASADAARARALCNGNTGAARGRRRGARDAAGWRAP
jgi:FAD/FMN-containing dehydrogenase